MGEADVSGALLHVLPVVGLVPLRGEAVSELLFERESALRQAARIYATTANDETRKVLRQAALAYADVANEIDEAAQEGAAS